jgi:hypothetical protein
VLVTAIAIGLPLIRLLPVAYSWIKRRRLFYWIDYADRYAKRFLYLGSTATDCAIVWAAGFQVLIRKGQSMSSLPWAYQSHVADAKIRKFETALQAIAGLDWNTMTSDQALANLRNVITIARDALERQGLSGSPWE